MEHQASQGLVPPATDSELDRYHWFTAWRHIYKMFLLQQSAGNSLVSPAGSLFTDVTGKLEPITEQHQDLTDVSSFKRNKKPEGKRKRYLSGSIRCFGTTQIIPGLCGAQIRSRLFHFICPQAAEYLIKSFVNEFNLCNTYQRRLCGGARRSFSELF